MGRRGCDSCIERGRVGDRQTHRLRQASGLGFVECAQHHFMRRQHETRACRDADARGAPRSATSIARSSGRRGLPMSERSRAAIRSMKAFHVPLRRRDRRMTMCTRETSRLSTRTCRPQRSRSAPRARVRACRQPPGFRCRRARGRSRSRSGDRETRFGSCAPCAVERVLEGADDRRPIVSRGQLRGSVAKCLTARRVRNRSTTASAKAAGLSARSMPGRASRSVAPRECRTRDRGAAMAIPSKIFRQSRRRCGGNNEHRR